MQITFDIFDDQAIMFNESTKGLKPIEMPLSAFKLFKVGIEYDSSQLNSEQLKKIITDYLSHAADSAANNPSRNWKEMLEPYLLRIEKLGDANNFPVIAEKDIGSTEIKWLFE